jgi:hypothetical protein
MCQTGRHRAKLRTVDLAVGDLVIDCDTITHPLLGDAFVICDRAGEPLTAMSAIDFDRPAEIPIIAAPGALPPGTGGPLLNFIAERARDAKIAALRYAGPYPTPSLYDALLRSFVASEDQCEFTIDLLRRMSLLSRDPVPVDFTPAPHRRVPFARGFTEVRNGVERAVIDGLSYDDVVEVNRTLTAGRAELKFGASPRTHIATFAPDGTIVDGPHSIPITVHDMIGREFPEGLRVELGPLVADLVVLPLESIAASMIAARTLVWADLGARSCVQTETGFALHVRVWADNIPLGLGQALCAMCGALHPVVQRTIIAELQPRLPA